MDVLQEILTQKLYMHSLSVPFETHVQPILAFPNNNVKSRVLLVAEYLEQNS
jgi:hypothetical protein